MAVAVFAAGTLALGVVDEVSIPLPAGSLAGKLLVAFVNSDEGALDADGWTTFKDTDGAVAQQLSMAFRFADGAEADPVVFVVNGSLASVGVIVAFSGVAASANPIGASGAATGAAASDTVTGADITTPTTNNGVVFVAMAQRALAGSACGVASGTNPTFAEAFDGATEVLALGLFLSIAVDFGVCTTAGAIGARTATLTNTPTENQGIMFSLLPALSGSRGGGGSRSIEPRKA